MSRGDERPIVYSPRRYHDLIGRLLKYGERVSPRGMETIEIMNAHLIVRNPLDRIIYDPGRKMNIAFAIADFAQVMNGEADLAFLTQFASGMNDFADPDDRTKVGGAYGTRIFWGGEFDQIRRVIDILKKDPDSRQAVVSIYHGIIDLETKRHVVPCTLTLQFLVRDEWLYLITNMRSNDIVWGLTYDVFMFTMMQEYVARQLGYEIGEYFHNAGSLHLYSSRDNDLVKSLKPGRVNLYMNEMPKDFTPRGLTEIIESASDLASRNFWDMISLGTYEANLALTTRYWLARKEGEYFEAKAAYDALTDAALRKALRLWPIKK